MTGSRDSGRGQVSGQGDASRRGSLNAPGALADAPVEGAETERSEAAQLPDEPLAGLAARYGLKPSAARPPLVEYIRRIWRRRYFVTGFATAQNVAMYTEARLGQVWQILTPLLNVAVYYLIFGLILNTNMLDPNALVTIDRKKIESLETSKVSPMPEGLIDTLKEDEILDLMAYLLSRGDRNHAMFKK